MKIFANLILLTVLCTHITPISSTYAISGSVLTDLTETTPGVFGAGWTLSNYVSSPTKTSFCDGLLLLGGYNVLGGSSGASFTASYNGIPTPHNRLTFTITFWILDSWTNGDRFDLVFDLVTLTGWSFPATSASGNLCGVGTAGDISGVTIAGQVAHSTTTLTFKVISQLSSASSTKSFGFRDITFTFDHVTTPPAINNTMCAITPIQMPTTPAATAVNTCSCLSTQYEYPTHTGNCYACHTDCLSCTLSASTSCTACQPGKYLYGTQCQPCDTSCATCSTGGSNNCTSCNSGSYLVQNQTCVTSAICSYPLIQVAANGTISPAECTSPCSSASDFIYWDQSCASTCPAMLQQDDIGGLKLCKYPCLTSEYLYWDGTCQSSCNFPLKIIVQKQRNYCSFPCSSTQYLLWNGSCISTCPFYFVEVIKNSLRYCKMRCPVGQYYTQWDGNCVTSCTFPFKTENYYCGLPCDDPFAYYYPHNRTCLEDCETPFQIQTTGIFEQCVYPELDSFMAKVFLLAPYEDNMPTLVVLVRIMQYVRYLNISMPPRLERLALSKGLNIMSFNYGFNMPSSISEGFTVNPIISVFENQRLHSQFLVNFWKDLVWIVGIFILAILCYISELFYNRTDLKTLETIFGAFKAITLWNFLIIFFATSIDDIILFSSIEFMSFYYSMNNVVDYVSFVSSIVGLCLVVILVIFALYILIKRAPTIKTGDGFSQAAAGFTNQYRSCSVLFLGFNVKTFFGKFFFLIYMARLGLPMVFAMSLISEPVINVFLQVMISGGIISCVIYFKPLKSQFNHFQLVLFEAIVLMMNVMMFLITVLKFYNIGSWETSVILGDIVIAGNSITNLLAILFAIFKIASEISYVSKLIKAKTFQEKLSFLIQLLVIPIQQGRMGFECIFGVYSLYSAPTELGFDAEKTEKTKNKKTPIVQNEEPGPNELPRLANKQVRAKDFDGSELKNRLASIGGNKRGYIEADLPYQMNPLSLATNISKPPAGLNQLNSLRGPTQALSKRENSIELPKISMTDSSLAPLANRGDLSILNNTSYDFGDSTLYDNPLSTKKGIKISDSVHFTPASVRAKQD